MYKKGADLGWVTRADCLEKMIFMWSAKGTDEIARRGKTGDGLKAPGRK